MPDLLVPLYTLPGAPRLPPDVTIRVARAYEASRVLDWVQREFGTGWRDEAAIALTHSPIACWLATRDGEILGFACYDTTAKGFFGPFGIAEAARQQGIGTALTLRVLAVMRDLGYAYGVIGGAGSIGFYEKILPVFEIPGSSPGIYGDRLRQ